MERLFEILPGLTEAEQEIVFDEKTTFPVDADDIGIRQDDNRVIYITWIAAAVQLRGCEPNLFPDHSPDEPILYHNISAENWNRAFLLLKHGLREIKRGVKEKDERGLSEEKNAIQLPVFLTDDDFNNMAQDDVHEDDALAAKSSLQMDFFNARQNLEDSLMTENHQFRQEDVDRRPDIPTDLPESDAELDIGDVMRSAAKLEHIFTTKMHSAVNSGDLKFTRSQRAKLTRDQAIHFCQQMGKRVEIMWGPEQIDAMHDELRAGGNDIQQARFLGIIASAAQATAGEDAEIMESNAQEDVATETQQPGPDNASNAGIPDNPQLGATPAPPLNESDDESADEDKISKQHYWAIKRQMTANSVAIPTLKEGCEFTGCTPEDMSIPGTDPPQTYLKWQPQSKSQQSLVNSSLQDLR
jgi:hypothetical protein